ncbi:MAG TPA: hypothetical protein VIF64_04375 [Pyrinomonadaceae bacterium]|jgi:hypothetical protein
MAAIPGVLAREPDLPDPVPGNYFNVVAAEGQASGRQCGISAVAYDMNEVSLGQNVLHHGKVLRIKRRLISPALSKRIAYMQKNVLSP